MKGGALTGSAHGLLTLFQRPFLARRRDRVGVTIQAFAIFALATLSACGVETATTAATSAAIKKQEIDQGKKTMDEARQKVEQAAQQLQQRAELGADAADK
jgi:hypothetical protein